MPRTWFVCLTIVAAFAMPLAAAAPPGTVLVPVSAPALAVARTLGLDPATDRVRFLPDFARLLHTGSDEKMALLEQLRRSGLAPAAPSQDGGTVVVPLDAERWSTAVFKRSVPLDQLLTTILTDRRAALLSTGLASLDDETLAYVAQATTLVTDLYERGAAPFAAFGASLRVRDGRIVTPGLESDRAVWEAVVGAPVDAPDRFVRHLFVPPTGGRLAYLYGTVALMEAPTVRFVLGPETRDTAARIERVRMLAAVAGSLYGEWKLDAFPFARPLHDLALLLTRLRVDRDGRPLPPADRAFWSEVWSVSAAQGSPTTAPSMPPDAEVDAAWLTEMAGGGNMFERGDRIDQFAFAQRVFGADAVSARADAIQAVRAFPRQKMLMLTLERMGLRAPAVYAFVSQRAGSLDVHDTNRGYWVMAQLQSALALLARMRMSGSLDARVSEASVRSLFAVPLTDQRYAGAMARWIEKALAPRLPSSTDVDTSVLMALAGPSLGGRAPRIEWEGERYRLDFGAAELRRLQAVRERQGGPTLDLAITLERVATALGDASLDQDALVGAQRRLQDVLNVRASELQISLTAADVAASGISAPRRLREGIEKIVTDLDEAIRAHDPRRASREASSLRELVDIAMGEALLDLAYAADIGDPDGPALLSRNGALRHDFGFGRIDTDTRNRLLWAVPRQDFQPGVAWHVTGSALGLDIALARLALTRINADRLGAVPRIPSIDRDGFAIGLALMQTRDLRDTTRDAIAAALALGTARVEAAAANAHQLERVASALRFDGLRRRSLRYMAADAPPRVPELFSLAELVQVGEGPTPSELAPWGSMALPLSGCPCTHVVLPSAWPLLIGRPQLSLAAASVSDLNIRVAAALSELRLPAQLAKPVLAAAIQDFIEDAAPLDGGDWWALSRAARTLSRERVEDYVAAAASVGGALVPDQDNREP